MVTKRPAWNLFDTLPKTNAPVLNHHPDRQTTYKSSPRPGLMDQADRERDMMREEEWRREQEIERLKDKKRNREKKTDPWDYYAERGHARADRGREGGGEWRDGDRRTEGERRTNGRPTANLEAEAVREMERGKQKGDTFPRMTRAFREQIQRMDPFKEGDVARVGRGHVERHKGTEMNDQERDRAARREWRREEDRYRERQSEGVRIRSREEADKYRGGAMEDGTVQQRERKREHDAGYRERRRERDSEGNDLWSRREKDRGRERDRPKPRHGERPRGIPSPQRRMDREYYSDREARDRPQRGDGKRDNRSEGDNDGDGRRQERWRGGDGREVRHRHSKSEEDDEGRALRETEGERKRYNDGERRRYRDNDREREGARPRKPEEARKRDGERERRKERELEGDRMRRRHETRDAEGSRQKLRDRREDDRIQNRGEEEGRRRRETKGKDSGGQTSQSTSEHVSRPPPQPQSSGEWSSGMESERRWRRAGQRREEREPGRESTAGREREVAEETSGGRERSQRECAVRERAYTDTESRSRERDRGAGRLEQRRMGRGYDSKDPPLQDRDLDRERLQWQRQVDATEPMEAEVGTVRGRDKQGDKNTKQRKARETDTETERQGREEEDIDQAAREGSRSESEKGVSVDGEEESEVWGGVDQREPQFSSDGERRDSSRSDSERASLTDKTDESDRGEEGGRDHCTHSDSEGGSETGLEEQRYRMPSAEDGFVTVSSGGDEEREEEEFEDCKEYLDDGVSYHATLPIVSKGHEGEHESPWEWTGGEEAGKGEVGDEEGRKRQPTYVFCVIGQTLPRSRPNNPSDLDKMESEESSPPDSGSGQCGSDDIPPHPERNAVPGRRDECNASDSGAQGGEAECERESNEHRVPRDVEDREEPNVTDVSPRPVPEPEARRTDEGLKAEAVHPYAEIGPPRDSETDKLLAEWRARHREHKQKERLELHSVNPHGDADSLGIIGPDQATSNETNTEAMDLEEPIGAAIQVRVIEAWNKADEAKRHSQAPHLKWAKNVVSEIFGASESQANAELHQVSQGRGPEKGQGDSTEGGEENSVHAALQRTRIQDGEPAAELGAQPLQPEDVRGMGLSQSHVHADVLAAMRRDTPTDTHADTSTDTEREEQVTCLLPDKPCDASVDIMAGEKERAKDKDAEDKSEGKSSREKEVEMYLTVCHSLYKPDSCPSLNYLVDPDVPIHPSEEETEGDQEERVRRCGSVGKEKRSVSEGEEMVRGGAVEKEKRSMSDGEDETRNVADEKKREVAKEIEVRDELNIGGGLVVSKVSFRDLGAVARMRRRGIRKTTERRKEENLEEEEGAAEGVAGDRQTRIFSTPDDEETRSDSWGDVELRNVLDTIQRKRKNSRFFNKAQLYQQYNEAAQNIEILRQSRSDFLSSSDDLPVSLIVPSPISSLSPSPPPACRPLPPLPSASQHHFLFPSGTFSSSVCAKTLPLPEPPKTERRASSPRLSASLGQSSTLWQELPGVRNSTELGELAEDQRRLQEVRFEVLTSEASYCRSLDIVVEHFVKSKQLGALLTAQDRNWLFSRLADVRAISHSFLSKLEERIDSDTIHFTVCDIIARYCPHFKMVYVPYLTNQSYQDATYQRLMSENPGFKRVVEKLERSTVCQRLPLRSFLILPFQRITRLKLLVQNILKRTAPGTEDETQAIKALKLLEKLIIESNDSITQMKSIESLVSLSAKVDFECRTLPLVSQSRRLVREGPVTEMMDFSMKESERNVYLHLFNDYLLLSLHKEGARFIVINHAPVSELRAENCRVKLLSLQQNLFRLYLSNKALLLRTDSQSDKLRWITAVSRPHPEIDYSAAQDLTQMQCIRAIIAQQPDEISLEKAEVILVHQQSSDGWVEGTRLSDRQRGWAPVSHLEAITSSRVRQRNLTDALKITTAAAAV